ncbi:unnamed protein product [Alopecurus aequalis]
MSSLRPKLGGLLLEEYNLHKGLKKGIKDLMAELEVIEAVLVKVSDVPLDQLGPLVKIWANDVRELSYAIEDKLDTFMVSVEDIESGKPHTLLGSVKKTCKKVTNLKIRRQIASDIKDVKIQVKEVKERYDRYKGVIGDSNARIEVDPANDRTGVDPRLLAMYSKVSDLVGIDKPIKELLKFMSKSAEISDGNLKIVSIAGFGGLGKTTLAKAVYEKLNKKFDCAGFVLVARIPDIKKVLRDILLEFDQELYNSSSAMDERQLINQLRKYLADKRYLIVIDDIWETPTWEKIKCSLVHNDIGSRIITTTRIVEIAQKVGGVYNMKPLSDDNSSCRLDHVGKLVMLRYLGLVNTPVAELPRNIGHDLKFLQTLDVRGSGIKELPPSVCELSKLMCMRSSKGMIMTTGIGRLTSLEELELFWVEKCPNFVKELGKLTEMSVLCIHYFDDMEKSLYKDLMESLRNMHKIQILKIISHHVYARVGNWEDFVPPSNLRELVLCGIALPRLPSWINFSCVPHLSCLSIQMDVVLARDMQILGRLPLLRSLILLNRGDCMYTVCSGEFQSLIYFSAQVEIVCGGEGALPLLQKGTYCLQCYDRIVEEIEEAVVELRLVAKAHPNRPTITIARWGDESRSEDDKCETVFFGDEEENDEDECSGSEVVVLGADQESDNDGTNEISHITLAKLESFSLPSVMIARLVASRTASAKHLEGSVFMDCGSDLGSAQTCSGITSSVTDYTLDSSNILGNHAHSHYGKLSAMPLSKENSILNNTKWQSEFSGYHQMMVTTQIKLTERKWSKKILDKWLSAIQACREIRRRYF